MASHLARTDSLFVPSPRAVLIDAGFTLVAYDGGRIAAIAAEQGVSVDPAAIDATEAAIRAELAHHDWPQQPGSGAPPAGGARFFRRVLDLAQARGRAGAPGRRRRADLAAPPGARTCGAGLLPGVVPALEALRAAGLQLAVVSNSEGRWRRCWTRSTSPATFTRSSIPGCWG